MAVSLYDAPTSVAAMNAMAAVRDYNLNPRLGTCGTACACECGAALTRRHRLQHRRGSAWPSRHP